MEPNSSSRSWLAPASTLVGVTALVEIEAVAVVD